MNRDQIIKLAREHDLNCYGSLSENSLYTEILCDFVAAIRSATKEEDARICEDSQDRGPDNGCCPTFWNESLDYAAKAIRASK